MTLSYNNATDLQQTKQMSTKKIRFYGELNFKFSNYHGIFYTSVDFN